MRVAIVGAGMSGLCVAHRLRAAGVEELVIHEKAGDVGGTWRENRYLGLTCDVPSRYYCYSFAPNPDWSHTFAPGAEILAYFRRQAEELGLRPLIRFDSEVVAARWRDGRWRLELADGTTDEADVLVSATGVLHHPRVPDIPGLESFAGEAFHSARWPDGLRVDRQRVGVVGNGSTGVQLVTAASQVAARVVLFQRTPQWVLPVSNRRYSRPGRALLRRFPRLNRLSYRFYQRQLEFLLGRGAVEPGLSRWLIAVAARANLRFGVRDGELRRHLTPDYEPLCKRIVMSGGFYRAMQRPNVELATERIERVTPRGVVTRDGREHALDVLVLATGFDAHAYLRPMEVVGEGGLTLEEAWRDGPRGYRTVALPGFPNLFTMMGPHSPVGNHSLVSIAETQADYIAAWVERLRSDGVASVVPTADATARFNADLRAALPRTVWSTGCSSWYLGADGRPELWPWTPARHRAMLAEPEAGDFALSLSGRDARRGTSAPPAAS
jgi:cation diffusion facilitator CzcD-associated flavoprotein CzcO